LTKFQQQVHLVDDALSSPHSSDFDRNSLAEAKESLPQRLASTIALVSPKSGDAAEVERRLGIRVNDRLDHGAVWREAHLTVRVPPPEGKGHWRSFQSAVIPLNKAFALYTGAMNFLPYGRAGFSSNSLSRGSLVEPSRLANGWLTLLHSGGKELFSGFRSGALGAASIGDAKGREEYGAKAAHELVTAAVAKRLLGELEEFRTKLFDGEAVLDLPITSLSLQTKWRPEDTSYLATKERIAMQTSFKALSSLVGENRVRLELRQPNGQVEERELRVRVQLWNFNYPPHHRTFREGVGFDEETIANNQNALERLLASIELPAEAIDRQVVEMLAESAREINKGRLWREAGRNPYKMNSILALLAYRLGHVVHFNCLSGKDRTGQLDVEVKLLAQQIDLAEKAGDIPSVWPSDAPLSENERETLSLLARYGGSFNSQSRNIGMPGSKLKPIVSMSEDDPLVGRFGVENWCALQGFQLHGTE
jgi:hypothetical protein